ncbi:MAG: cell envelope integrity protein TolA [Candidatus Accumulibacter sp.]|nr:cell envelope integrity protein TolA [Accumulibacter sp.]
MDNPAPLPPKEKTSVTAMVLAVLVHALLIGALFLGVQWKSQTPSAVTVEVWQSAPAPVVAARPEPDPEPPPPKPTPEPVPEPPPPEPSLPPPPDPDIGIKDKLEKERLEEERLEKERLEKKRLEEERQKEESLEKERRAKEQLDKERLEKERQDRERRDKERQEAAKRQTEADAEKNRMAAIANADAELRGIEAARKTAARERAEKAYIAKIGGKIRGNIVLPLALDGNPEAVFKVTQLPTGEIIGDPRIVKSSGNRALDEAVMRAIKKSSPLPLPDDRGVFDRELNIPYRPFDE